MVLKLTDHPPPHTNISIYLINLVYVFCVLPNLSPIVCQIWQLMYHNSIRLDNPSYLIQDLYSIVGETKLNCEHHLLYSLYYVLKKASIFHYFTISKNTNRSVFQFVKKLRSSFILLKKTEVVFKFQTNLVCLPYCKKFRSSSI
jgi:hypothetical protein